MIILIGGMSHTGKTFLAQKLLEKHKITYLSLDHLKMGLCRGLDEEKYSPVQDYRTLGEIMWPIVKGIIKTNIENGQSVIVEGCYILPHLVYNFDESYLQDIVSVFIGFTPEYIKNNYPDITYKYARVIEKRGYVFSETMEEYIRQSEELRAECENKGCTYFAVEKNYKVEMQSIMDYISGKITGSA